MAYRLPVTPTRGVALLLPQSHTTRSSLHGERLLIKLIHLRDHLSIDLRKPVLQSTIGGQGPVHLLGGHWQPNTQLAWHEDSFFDFRWIGKRV